MPMAIAEEKLWIVVVIDPNGKSMRGKMMGDIEHRIYKNVDKLTSGVGSVVATKCKDGKTAIGIETKYDVNKFMEMDISMPLSISKMVKSEVESVIRGTEIESVKISIGKPVRTGDF